MDCSVYVCIRRTGVEMRLQNASKNPGNFTKIESGEMPRKNKPRDKIKSDRSNRINRWKNANKKYFCCLKTKLNAMAVCVYCMRAEQICLTFPYRNNCLQCGGGAAIAQRLNSAQSKCRCFMLVVGYTSLIHSYSANALCRVQWKRNNNRKFKFQLLCERNVCASN